MHAHLVVYQSLYISVETKTVINKNYFKTETKIISKLKL